MFNLEKLGLKKNKNKKSSVLGLDIGSQVIKVVKMTHNEGVSQLDFCGMIDTPQDAKQIEPTLKNYISQNKLGGVNGASCIDDSSLKIRKIELPAMPEADLKEAVGWKMRDIVEGSIDDFLVRHSTLAETKSQDKTKMTLVGYALKRKVIEARTKLMEKAGLLPEFVEPTAVSLAAIVESIYPSDSEDHANEWVAGIDLGYDKAIMVIVGHGKFYFSRPIHGVELKNLSEEEDQTLFFQKIAAEIQNSVDTFSITFNVDHINHIFLGGGGAGITGVDEYLTTNLGITTEILNPFLGLEIPENLTEAATAKPYLYSQAVSLAKIVI